MEALDFEIQSAWDGSPLHPGEAARVGVEWAPDGEAFWVQIEAADYGDPPPSAQAGSLAGLWNDEVVEVFLVSAREQYLELEFGPHGHYLALRLSGPRQVVEEGLLLEYSALRSAGSWTGRACVPAAYLPGQVERANAFSIHGVGPARRYLAASALPGTSPDFHRLDAFPSAAHFARDPAGEGLQK